MRAIYFPKSPIYERFRKTYGGVLGSLSDHIRYAIESYVEAVDGMTEEEIRQVRRGENPLFSPPLELMQRTGSGMVRVPDVLLARFLRVVEKMGGKRTTHTTVAMWRLLHIEQDESI